jgi:hypothetical protein
VKSAAERLEELIASAETAGPEQRAQYVQAALAISREALDAQRCWVAKDGTERSYPQPERNAALMGLRYAWGFATDSLPSAEGKEKGLSAADLKRAGLTLVSSK